jgi:hypothetical protein
MLYLLFFSMLILTVLVLYLVIKYTKVGLHSYLLVPFLIFNIGFGWYTVDELWGSPSLGIPQDKKFQVVFVTMDDQWIYLLLTVDEDKEPKYYKIIRTDENKKKARNAAMLMKKGIRVVGEIKIKREENGTIVRERQLNLYQWNHQTGIPKNG